MREMTYQNELVKTSRVIATPSDFAKENLIYLQEMGISATRQSHLTRRSGLDSILFFRVLEGRGRLIYEGKEYDLQEGDCVFLDCHHTYAQISGEPLWTLQWVHFYGSNLQRLYNNYLQSGGRVCFSTGAQTQLNELWEKIDTIEASDAGQKELGMHSALTELTVLLMELGSPEKERDRQTGGQGEEACRKTAEYLREHYTEHISLDHLSELFYINKYYLTRVFKEDYGVTINQYLLQIRMNHAKELLRYSDLSVEAVGRACGMGAAAYFTRTFKRAEGITPGEYRRLW